ncbi:MAG: hypothetical protein LUG18_04225 [Candidatus Azobacteroides sp.]|nr:hypothetical protein [Candidatus Azobacteroides sp.]
MEKYLFFVYIATSILFTSCASGNSLHPSVNPEDASRFSKFSGFTELGISKAELTNRFGPSTSKDMYKENNKVVETLSYVEFLDNDRISLTTKFIFEDDRLKEQKTITEISQTCRKELKELQYQLNVLRHQMMFK